MERRSRWLLQALHHTGAVNAAMEELMPSCNPLGLATTNFIAAEGCRFGFDRLDSSHWDLGSWL
jgi:hypothetical protein